MHEYSIVQALVEQIERQAGSRGATSIRRVEVGIGELAGVEVDLLRTAWETFREPTLCRGAELAIEEIPMRWLCPSCRRSFSAGEPLRCALCQRPARLEQGDEILLQRIEMEVA